MNRLNRDELYQVLVSAGYEDTKERQAIANKFINKTFTLFSKEAEEVARMAYQTINERQTTLDALNRFVDCANKIHDILEKGFDECQSALFQTVRAREVFALYTSLRRVGASEETCSYALYGFLTGKPLEDENGEAKVIPNLDEIKKELDSIRKKKTTIDLPDLN